VHDVEQEEEDGTHLAALGLVHPDDLGVLRGAHVQARDVVDDVAEDEGHDEGVCRRKGVSARNSQEPLRRLRDAQAMMVTAPARL